jgi:hypothetical protein
MAAHRWPAQPAIVQWMLFPKPLVQLGLEGPPDVALAPQPAKPEQSVLA